MSNLNRPQDPDELAGSMWEAADQMRATRDWEPQASFQAGLFIHYLVDRIAENRKASCGIFIDEASFFSNPEILPSLARVELQG
ncbi:MAG: hypothetical protein F2806_09090, partial [Actinobacteria bacterium]|nr:hypothetical protein [Actinomycetota bacterium]